VASSAVQIACGRDPYRDNHFEREAFAVDDARRGERVTSRSAAADKRRLIRFP